MGICCHKWGKFVLSPCHFCGNKQTNVKNQYRVNDKVEDDKNFFPKKEKKNDGLWSKNKFSSDDIIKVLTIKEEENNKEYIKVKEHIENHFFGTKNEKKNNIIIYKDKSINLEITTIIFNELILYSSNKYDYILSFLNNK